MKKHKKRKHNNEAKERNKDTPTTKKQETTENTNKQLVQTCPCSAGHFGDSGISVGPFCFATLGSTKGQPRPLVLLLALVSLFPNSPLRLSSLISYCLCKMESTEQNMKRKKWGNICLYMLHFFPLYLYVHKQMTHHPWPRHHPLLTSGLNINNTIKTC